MNTKKVQGKNLEALNKIADLVLNRSKITEKIYKTPSYNDEPKIFSYSTKYETKYKNVYDIASGVSFGREIALVRALGETIERYAINKSKTNVVANGTVSEIKKLGLKYLNPVDISPFSKKQLQLESFKQFRIKSSSKFKWTTGVSINKKGKILIPCQLVSFNYERIKEEPIILPLVSTGTAFGLTFEDALYRAICEIIERDAFMIAYLNKLPNKKIDLISLKDRDINNILQILKRYNLELIVLDMTSDLNIPVFGAIVIDRTGLGPAVSVGLKCGLEIKDVLIGSIEESLMTRSWIRDKFIYLNPDYKKNKVIKNIEQRAYFWFPNKMIKELDFWLKTKNRKKLNLKINTKQPLKEVLNRLKVEGMDVIYIDITPSDVKKEGFVVLRVIIPEMEPLHLDESFKFLGNKRLYDVPIKLGFIDKKSNENNLNTVPHPFL